MHGKNKIKYRKTASTRVILPIQWKRRPISTGIIIHCVNAGVAVQLNFDFSSLHSLCKWWWLLVRLFVCLRVCEGNQQQQHYICNWHSNPFFFSSSFWLNTHCNQFSIHLFRSRSSLLQPVIIIFWAKNKAEMKWNTESGKWMNGIRQYLIVHQINKTALTADTWWVKYVHCTTGTKFLYQQYTFEIIWPFLENCWPSISCLCVRVRALYYTHFVLISFIEICDGPL